jgi:hypothetical protein
VKPLQLPVLLLQGSVNLLLGGLVVQALHVLGVVGDELGDVGGDPFGSCGSCLPPAQRVRSTYNAQLVSETPDGNLC